MSSTPTTPNFIKLEPSIALHNAVLVNKAGSQHDLYLNSHDVGVYAIVLGGVSYPANPSWNPLMDCLIHFPSFNTTRIEQELLYMVFSSISGLCLSIEHRPEYVAVVETFDTAVLKNTGNPEGRPSLEFVFENHYLHIKSYAQSHFGNPSSLRTMLPSTLLLGQMSTSRQVRRFINQHLHRIGMLSQQYGHILELP